VLKYSF